MALRLGPADDSDDREIEGDFAGDHRRPFSGLESVDADVSPQVVPSVQATINEIKGIDREFGLMTEGEVMGLLGPGNSPVTHGFTLRYRGEVLYPRFLFAPSYGDAGPMRVRPLINDLKKIADENGWTGPDVVLWMTSRTTWFADESRPVDHLDEPARVLGAFEDEAGGQW